MSVGTGSIKRAAAKATEAPKAEGAEVTANVIANPSEQVVEKIVEKAAEKTTKKTAAKKTAARKSTKAAGKSEEKAAVMTPGEGKPVAKSANEVCQLTQEMPIHLL